MPILGGSCQEKICNLPTGHAEREHSGMVRSFRVQEQIGSQPAPPPPSPPVKDWVLQQAMATTSRASVQHTLALVRRSAAHLTMGCVPRELNASMPTSTGAEVVVGTTLLWSALHQAGTCVSSSELTHSYKALSLSPMWRPRRTSSLMTRHIELS